MTLLTGLWFGGLRPQQPARSEAERAPLTSGFWVKVPNRRHASLGPPNLCNSQSEAICCITNIFKLFSFFLKEIVIRVRIKL